MQFLNQINHSGIYENHATQCFEAWEVYDNRKRLLSSCSMSVPTDQFKWWKQQLNHSLNVY
jgi:hypothetical protein